MHYGPEWTRDKCDGRGRVAVTLTEGDSAWCPVSTKKIYRGAGTIEYLYWPDGGIDCHITSGNIWFSATR